MKALLVALALLAAALSPPAFALVAENAAGAEQFAYVAGGRVHAQVRYFDGLASTKVAFLMLQGQSGLADDRLSPGARCTEWHGTFTQASVKAREADNAVEAFVTIQGAAAAAPPGATGARAGVGWLLDVLGGAGAWDAVLLVCDHPDGDGAVDFQGSVAPMPFTHAPAYAGLVTLQEA